MDNTSLQLNIPLDQPSNWVNLSSTAGGEKVSFSPDSLDIVSGSGDSTIRMWDIETKKLLFILEGHLSAVFSVAFSIDGEYILSGSGDGTIRVAAVVATAFQGKFSLLCCVLARWQVHCVGIRQWHYPAVGRCNGRADAIASERG